MLLGMMKYFHHDQIWTCFLEPTIHFSYTGFDFVKPLPGNGLYVVFFLIAVAAGCICIGFRYRMATLAFFCLFTYTFLLDQSWYLNHYYLVCLLAFLLLFLPANQSFAIDSLRNPRIRSRTTPAWTLWLLRIQVGIPYVYGGIAKLNSDWFHGEPMRSWLADRTNFPMIGQFFTEEWCVYLFSYGGLVIDLIGVPLLLWKPTRWVALAFMMMFHLLNAKLFHIGIFPWMMIAATIVLFLPPELVGKCRFWNRQDADPAASTNNVQTRFALPPFTRILLLTFVVLQLVIPFRHFLYPGSVALTREGHCFSWRMKLNNRKMVRDLKIYHTDGRIEPLREFEWITWEQASRFRSINQILQMARAVRHHHEARDGSPVSVRGTVTVAVNENPPVQLVDDDVDLSRISPSFFAANWIETHPLRQQSASEPPKNEVTKK